MGTTVRKWGNSLGIRIPRAIAEQLDLVEGSEVDFETVGGVLSLVPRRRSRVRLKDLLQQAKGPSPHRDLDRNRRVGRELL